MTKINTFITSLLIGTLQAEKLPDIVDFNDHIQPILSENCYHCHGPDGSTREPSENPLRLDREEFAFLKRPNGQPAIIKGNADKSLVIQRIILPADHPDVMPTAKSHKPPLNPHQVALLKKWINQGAPYEEHWSFIKPTKSKLPPSTWAQNPIDNFIHAKHKKQKLTQSPPEKPHRLLRRLTFDITGLPPSIQQISEFEKLVAATDLPSAVKTTTDQLLKTDAYAEHFGRHWLDAARYADTHGIHIDNYRAIWPYRDWVINAFRQNMPFDQFTREQLAGDLLPKPSLEQKVATGFNRCLPTTGEGGAIDDEYRAIYAKDQVETTSAIWLGLSTGCAACHDHKFDPISQKDYYAMAAFFRNTTMHPMDRNKADHPPNIFVPQIADRTRLTELQTELQSIKADLDQRRSKVTPDFQKWLSQQLPDKSIIATPRPSQIHPLSLDGNQLQIQNNTVTYDGQTIGTPGGKKAPRLHNGNTNLGDILQFGARDQITITAQIHLLRNSRGAILSRLDESNKYRGWDIWLERNGHLGVHFIDQWPNKAIKAVSKTSLPPNKWHHITITYDGKAQPKQSIQIFLNGNLVPLRYEQAGTVDTLQTQVPARLGARSPDSRLIGYTGLNNLQIYDSILNKRQIAHLAGGPSLETILPIPEDQRTEAQRDFLVTHFLDNHDPINRELKNRQKNLLQEEKNIKRRGSATLIMKEKPGPAFAHLLNRGDYSDPRDKVYANIPEIFQTTPSDNSKKSRLHLANWITSEENPLTARVTVNRLWYYFFGRGIVETTEDFGIMGARPTHPQLLDYLATELLESNWDLHHVIRLITNSATYQQSGNTTISNKQKDPLNKYLWRASRFRMDAEQIRDMSLLASELLVRKIGGPSVKPYQPDGLWKAVAMHQSNTRNFKKDSGENLYRRSLYTFWKRTAAPPSMEILNAPTREVFCVRRELTNTPLAAFVTMNDTQFLEAARQLATNALKRHPDFDQRLDHLTLSFMARKLNTDERAIVKSSYQKQLQQYRNKPELAKKIINIGDSKPDQNLNEPELATWTLLASQIFNLDETLTK